MEVLSNLIQLERENFGSILLDTIDIVSKLLLISEDSDEVLSYLHADFKSDKTFESSSQAATNSLLGDLIY